MRRGCAGPIARLSRHSRIGELSHSRRYSWRYSRLYSLLLKLLLSLLQLLQKLLGRFDVLLCIWLLLLLIVGCGLIVGLVRLVGLIGGREEEPTRLEGVRLARDAVDPFEQPSRDVDGHHARAPS